jgi:two-component SAPR family response regulator
MAIIALGGRDIAESQLTDLLWPDSEGDAAYRSLITTLKRLRELLTLPHAIELKGGRVSLDPKQVWVDEWCFERDVGHGRTLLNGSAERVLSLYQGPFLNGVTEAWAIRRREKLAARFRQHVLQHGRHLEQTDSTDEAITWYLRALEAEDGDPAIHEGLIGCYKRQGREGEALAAVERLRRSR